MNVGYSKTFPHPSTGQWEKIWAEEQNFTGTIEEARKVWYAIKKEVENFHYESNKAAEKQTGVQVKVIEERPKDQTEGIIFDINNCLDAAVLEKTYHLLAKSYPAIKEAYDLQLQKLTI